MIISFEERYPLYHAIRNSSKRYDKNDCGCYCIYYFTEACVRFIKTHIKKSEKNSSDSLPRKVNTLDFLRRILRQMG